MNKSLIFARRLVSFVGAAFILGLPSMGFAVGSGWDYDHGMMMGSWGWAGMIIGPIMMIAVLATVVIVVVLILRWLGGDSPSAQAFPPRSGKAALDILKERFAKGEIEKDEFEERRRVLDE